MGQQSKSILEVGICVTVAIESEEGTLEGRLKKVFVIVYGVGSGDDDAFISSSFIYCWHYLAS